MTAVLARRPVPELSENIPKLIDHRYFYNTPDPKLGRNVGHCTCGLARKAVGTMLLVGSNVRFCDMDFLQSLPDYIHNPSVVGFMIEQAVLSSIALNGLNIRPETNRRMVVKAFEEEVPNVDDDTEGPILYLPQAFNFKAIDGVIVVKEPEPKEGLSEKKLLVLPLQITVAERHSDSHETFFSEWNTWNEKLKRFNVEPHFIWITEDGGKPIHHRRAPGWPAHYELDIGLNDVNKHIGSSYKDAKGGLIQQTPGRPSTNRKNKGKNKAKEPEDLVEQTRSDGPSAAAGKRLGKQPTAKTQRW